MGERLMEVVHSGERGDADAGTRTATSTQIELERRCSELERELEAANVANIALRSSARTSASTSPSRAAAMMAVRRGQQMERLMVVVHASEREALMLAREPRLPRSAQNRHHALPRGARSSRDVLDRM